jgi:hypothetical protein
MIVLEFIIFVVGLIYAIHNFVEAFKCLNRHY